MLRKRSRPAGGSKQSLMMSESSPVPSPTAKFSRPITSLFPSPRLFAALPAAAKVAISDCCDAAAAAMSPTSILENKSFSANPFFADRINSSRRPLVSLAEPTASIGSAGENKHHHHHPWEKVGDSGRVGLGGIVDALKDDDPCCDDNTNLSKPEKSRMVLFGSQLKIQIPPILPTPSSPAASVDSPRSPIEFGIKTRSTVLGSVSPPIGRSPSPLGSSIHSSSAAAEAAVASSSPRVIAPEEMEMSEDYTCVIVHGPNPRTTHIFDNCIVESRDDDYGGFTAAAITPRKGSAATGRVRYPSDSFLSFCYACKKALGDGEDIYMYRGEKAFCSHECRYQEILFEEGSDDDKCLPIDDEL